MKKTFTLGIVAAATAVSLAAPVNGNAPETWFHFVDGNVSKAGIDADLDAIASAGIGGIQFFHGGFNPTPWKPGTDPVYCLSPKWRDCLRYVAEGCRRRGLTFKMQNCPGWSMAGGPWITLDNCQRDLKWEVSNLDSKTPIDPESIPKWKKANEANRDYRDILIAAFPSPEGTEGATLVPTKVTAADNKREQVLEFADEVTVRSLIMPRASLIASHDFVYTPDFSVALAVERDGKWEQIREWQAPKSNWQDSWEPDCDWTLAVPEVKGRRFRVSVAETRKEIHHVERPTKFEKCLLSSVAYSHNFEAAVGLTLIAQMRDPEAKVDAKAIVDPATVRIYRRNSDGKWSDASGAQQIPAGKWTVIRFCDVNSLRQNGPAPIEGRGWECDKLNPRGIEANFAGYIRKAKSSGGPVEGMLKGMLLDSWECHVQTWTPGMESIFAKERGHDIGAMWPALAGYVVKDRASTQNFLREWRTLIGDLLTRNFFGRMAELAHAENLTVAFETACGDATVGDILEYYKYADVPMCEFWQPASEGYVGALDFKPIRPCASAAHLYGKKRVDAESLTSFTLTWDEDFNLFKQVVDRHFGRGVTHVVFHTYTHNPQAGAEYLPPGTSFGGGIGSPFLRGQTWWPYMRHFTSYLGECTELLEKGVPVVDVLLYLGDDQDHVPDQRIPFRDTNKYDYCNPDALFNVLKVMDGKLVTSEGVKYSVLWVREGTYLTERTKAKLAELKAAGVQVVSDVAAAKLPPDFEHPAGPLSWYHRREGNKDFYFIAATEGAYSGKVKFFNGMTTPLELAAGVSVFVEVRSDQRPFVHVRFPTVYGNANLKGEGVAEVKLGDWNRPIGAWKDLPGNAEEKAFSGTREYIAKFVVEKDDLHGRDEYSYCLDLGKVCSWAEVSIDDGPTQVLWHAPYRFVGSAKLTPGEHTLRIKVTSTWYNRLVYDAGLPEAERKTWTIRGPKKDAPLHDSGLIGPLKMYVLRPVPIEI